MPICSNESKSFIEVTDQPDNALLTSEISLVFAPKNNFTVTSWIIFDDFMHYATEVLTISLINLIKNGYMAIEKEETYSFKFLGKSIFTQINYSIQLIRRPSENSVIGWLEEKIFAQFKNAGNNDLGPIIYETLNEIFDGNHKHINPGKVLTLELLKHQKLNLYQFDHKKNFFSNKVKFWYNSQLSNDTTPKLIKLNDLDFKQFEIKELRRVIKSKLTKFQNLD
jgi:hypothetical protein